MKKPLILYHFNDKETLWQQSMLSMLSEFEREMGQAVQQLTALHPKADRASKIRYYLNVFILSCTNYPLFWRTLLRESSTDGPRVE